MAKKDDPTRFPQSEDRLEFLSRVASMYYEQEMTQQAISDTLGYSRSAISRFLTEAREVGIIEIRIRHPLERSVLFEQRLKDTFSLQDARVLVRNTLTHEQVLGRLGALAARLVEQVVQNGDILGVSWGTSVYEIANALRPSHKPDVRVVQLIGSLGKSDPQIDGAELARWFARWCGGRYYTIPTPLIVDSRAVRDALINDSRVKEVLEDTRKVNVAVVGIGTTNPEMASLVRAEYLTADEVLQIAADGAVGDICAIHFDINGNILSDIPIAQRVIGIDPDILKKVPTIIGMAASDIKAPAILGALRSGLVNVLVSDDITVQQVLDLNERT